MTMMSERQPHRGESMDWETAKGERVWIDWCIIMNWQGPDTYTSMPGIDWYWELIMCSALIHERGSEKFNCGSAAKKMTMMVLVQSRKFGTIEGLNNLYTIEWHFPHHYQRTRWWWHSSLWLIDWWIDWKGVSLSSPFARWQVQSIVIHSIPCEYISIQFVSLCLSLSFAWIEFGLARKTASSCSGFIIIIT